MSTPLLTTRVPFILCSFAVLVLSVESVGPIVRQTLEINLEAARSLEPLSSPESIFNDNAEPSTEPELPSMSISSLVSSSYRRNADFIRQGLPMPLVQSFYNYALKQATASGCVTGLETVISGQCSTPLFDESDDYALKTLQNVIAEERDRPATDKFFPDLTTRTDLPSLTIEEEQKISATESQTLQALTTGVDKNWAVSVFPKDEEIRFDPGRNASCSELTDKMPYSGLTMTASSLTAYVLGMAAEITLTNGDSPQARMILGNHVKLMYLAARCHRVSGEDLEVPTLQLYDLIRRGKLALIAKTEASESSLPPLENMKDIVDASRHFFAEEIERMSSMLSFGNIHYLSWSGNSLSSELLDSRMAGKTTLQSFKDYFSEKIVSTSEPDFPCEQGFLYRARLAANSSDAGSCCAETCIVSSGRVLDLFIVNEMCCLACNQISCDLNKLARVIQVEAFRFSRSGGQ